MVGTYNVIAFTDQRKGISLNILSFKHFSQHIEHSFKNRTGPAGPTDSTPDRSRFWSGPVNWTGIWLNRNQIGWTDGPTDEPSNSPRTGWFNLFFLFFTASNILMTPNKPTPVTPQFQQQIGGSHAANKPILSIAHRRLGQCCEFFPDDFRRRIFGYAGSKLPTASTSNLCCGAPTPATGWQAAYHLSPTSPFPSHIEKS